MAIHHFSKFLANNRSTDVSIVDVVPSHHCALPQTNNTVDTLLKCMCNARGCGNVQVHTKNKIRKFLLKAFHPFIQKFAPAKISRYTVCDTRSLRVNNRTMNLNNSVAHIQTQTYHGYEWMTFRLVERAECCHGRDKTNPRTLFHHSSQRYSGMLPCHTLDNGNQLQRRRGGRQCFKKVLLFARGKCTSLMNN